MEKPEAVMFGGQWYEVVDDEFQFEEESHYFDYGNEITDVVVFTARWSGQLKRFHVPYSEVQAMRYTYAD